MADTNRAEILAIRKGMWEKVASRLHSPLKIFPFGENANEAMLYGTVAYVLKDGRKADVSSFLPIYLFIPGGEVEESSVGQNGEGD